MSLYLGLSANRVDRCAEVSRTALAVGSALVRNWRLARNGTDFVIRRLSGASRRFFAWKYTSAHRRLAPCRSKSVPLG